MGEKRELGRDEGAPPSRAQHLASDNEHIFDLTAEPDCYERLLSVGTEAKEAGRLSSQTKDYRRDAAKDIIDLTLDSDCEVGCEDVDSEEAAAKLEKLSPLDVQLREYRLMKKHEFEAAKQKRPKTDP